LAAILFIISLSPLVEKLRPLCQVLNGLTLTPHLFADDPTLLALTREAREKLIGAVVIWSKRWKSSIKETKSCLLSTNLSDSLQSIVAGKVFKEKTHAILLGAGVGRDGVFTTAHVVSKIRKLEGKLSILTNAGVRLGGLRADACVHLFNQSALTLATYALAMCPSNSRRIEHLDEAQIAFANRFLELPDDTPGVVGKSELGLIDMQLRASRMKVLLLHRVMSNELDPITSTLVHWPISEDGASWYDICADELGKLGIREPIKRLLKSPYDQLSAALLESAKEVQQVNWRVDSACVSNKTNNHHISKSVWGFENALLLRETRGIKAYIRMRAGLVEIPRRPGTSVCGLCLSHLPTTALTLWECHSLRAPRKHFLRSLELVDQSLYRAILAASFTNAMHMVLGKLGEGPGSLHYVYSRSGAGYGLRD
jgi:hypothetical protein